MAAESGVPVSTPAVLLRLARGPARGGVPARADALRDNTAWRQLVASVVPSGIERGVFSGRYDPDKVAVLAVAAAYGMGIPLSLGDPEITAGSAVRDVLAALRELLRP